MTCCELMFVDILLTYYRLPFSISASNNEQAAAKAAAVNADSGAPTMYLPLALPHSYHFKVTKCLYF